MRRVAGWRLAGASRLVRMTAFNGLSWRLQPILSLRSDNAHAVEGGRAALVNPLRMVLTLLGMVAAMELGFIRDRQRAAIDPAKAPTIALQGAGERRCLS